MSWRVLEVAIISFGGIILLAMGNLELADTLDNPCYHHIDAAYDCSMYYQFSIINYQLPILSLPRSTGYNMQCQFNKDI